MSFFHWWKATENFHFPSICCNLVVRCTDLAFSCLLERWIFNWFSSTLCSKVQNRIQMKKMPRRKTFSDENICFYSFNLVANFWSIKMGKYWCKSLFHAWILMWKRLNKSSSRKGNPFQFKSAIDCTEAFLSIIIFHPNVENCKYYPLSQKGLEKGRRRTVTHILTP